MKKVKPSESQVTEAIKSTDTDTISASWLQRKFGIGFNDSRDLFQDMQDWGLINSFGNIKIEQYEKDPMEDL